MGKVVNMSGDVIRTRPSATESLEALEFELLQLQRDRAKVDLENAKLQRGIARSLNFELAWRAAKHAIFWGFVLWIVLAVMHGARAESPQRVFRDAGGRTIGTATTSGNQTTFRDAGGRTTGTATTSSSGQTTFRNERGSTIGTSSGPRR